MRTIFISPVLWQRFNRAMRRRQEGQAMVLLALVAIGLIATVGLAIDGSLLFTESQKLQFAADTAAFQGAKWMPGQVGIADSYGQAAIQNYGYNLVSPSPANSTSDISVKQGNRALVEANPPGAYTLYQSNDPAPAL